MAIDKAAKNTTIRGTVLDISLMPGSFTDLLLFTGTQVVFIWVMRIRTHACDPKEIEQMFKEVIHGLRNVPLSPVVCREIHVLAPWGAWQYFRIDDDRVIEIRRDGAPLMKAG